MASALKATLKDKQTQVILFSSTAIALYGYDQGMMSLINTNYDYLKTMGLPDNSPLVGVIVCVYYLGCAAGAVLFSKISDIKGRKPSILACLATASVGNLISFFAGWNNSPGGVWVMCLGRIVMGVGVGGIDAVVPVYTAELSADDQRGEALAKEFQANILGLNIAFILNVALTQTLGKASQWAWRVPVIVMQIFPIMLFSGTALLPETPRWYILKGRDKDAKRSIDYVFGKESSDELMASLKKARKVEEEKGMILYADMVKPSGAQYHPTMVTVMGQINQALTGYGAVSVYGTQIFELLGFEDTPSQYITMGNYIFYFIMMTLAWILIDRKGRRWLLVNGAFWLSISFGILTVFGALAVNSTKLHIPQLAAGVPGTIVLYLATSVFGIGWLVPPWLIPTEIYPSTARANGSSISVIIWGFANFIVTLLTPVGFTYLKWGVFLVFCFTNLFAGWWSYVYCPESGTRTFEENQEFFAKAKEAGSWKVKKVDGGSYLGLKNEKSGGSDEEGSNGADSAKPKQNGGKKPGAEGEREPLLGDSNGR